MFIYDGLIQIFKQMEKQIIKTKIAIIGCGPIGIFGSLLFQHFGIEYVALERHPSIRAYPNAHYISPSSKTLLSQIPGLNQELNRYQQQQKWQFYSCFRYVQTIFGYQFCMNNLFKPSIQQKLKQCQLLFGEKPSHIPQNKFLKIMYNLLKDKSRIIFGQDIAEIVSSYSQEERKTYYILINQSRQKVVKAEYVILCNGSSSKLRENLPSEIVPIKMQGQQNMMNFINIHFTSDKLAAKINQLKLNAMYHFVYNKKILAILTSSTVVRSGEFVLQVTNYEPIVDLLQVYEPKQLIAMIFQENSQQWEIINDISIISTNKWQLSGLIADKFFSSGIFLAGDSAHSLPTAGGFGMNIGLHDIHQLVHCFVLLQNNHRADKFKVFDRYSKNRWQIDYKYLRKAMQNYEIAKATTKKLGLSTSPVEIFSNNSLLKSMISTISQKKPHYMQKIRLKAFGIMYKRVEFSGQPLDLFYDQFDIHSQKPSIIKNKIMKRNSRYPEKNEKDRKFYSLYARQWSISIQEISHLLGQVKSANIKFFSSNQADFQFGQRLISSDGTILIL